MDNTRDHTSRRNFLVAAAGGALAATASPAKPTLCIFSKHMPNLGYDDLGRVSREIGFGGIDLTVLRAAGLGRPA